MATLSSIKRLHAVIERSTAMINPTMDHDRVTDAIIALCDAINSYAETNETEHVWNIGEFGAYCIYGLIVGAHQHYAENHEGQASNSYKALSALGSIYEPNGSTVKHGSTEFMAYDDLRVLKG